MGSLLKWFWKVTLCDKPQLLQRIKLSYPLEVASIAYCTCFCASAQVQRREMLNLTTDIHNLPKLSHLFRDVKG